MSEDLIGDEDTVTAPLHLVPRDKSFDHALDETAPKPEPVHDGDGIEIPALGGERRDIIPEHLRTWPGIKSTAGKYLDAARFHTLYHLVRVLPMYLPLGVFWACAGVVKIAKTQLAWWWVSEQSYLRSKAIVDGNSPEYRALMREVRKYRSWRGAVVGAEAFAIVLTFVLIGAFAPWWSWFIVAAVTMPPLAHHGHPSHRPIVQSAVTTPLVRKINTDAVIRAYEAAGLCSTDPKKPADHLGFEIMTRDALDKSSQVVVYLPYGGTFAAVVNAKTKIASGLDVAESQVYFTKDKQSERRHALRVLDADPLSEPAGRTPLLDCKQRSVWRKAPLGIDQFGRKVAVFLLWISLLIGAAPRQGKTFTGRALALYCALDPWVDITLIDFKNSKDWQSLQLVAKRFVQGLYPYMDDTGTVVDPVERALKYLREIDEHIAHVNEELKKLPVTVCPEGKLTEELYKRDDLHVQLVILEEFQCCFELDDKKKNAEFAQLLARIGAMGPSAGVLLMSLSQKPSQIGGGADAQRLFTRFRDNHIAKFGLYSTTRDVSNAILGNEAYGEGYDCTKLPRDRKGVGILYGLWDEAPTVRTYLIDGPEAEVICRAARKIREKKRTLSGDALGIEPVQPGKDIVTDLLMVIGSERSMSWATAAERLAAQYAERYEGETALSVSETARNCGVTSIDVKIDGRTLKGCRKDDLEHVRERS